MSARITHGVLMFKKSYTTNVFLFLTGWIICLSTSLSEFSSAITLATTITILLIHIKFIGNWDKEKEILLISLLLGSAIDSFAGNLGILEFSTTNRLLPLWMACIWALAGTTIRHSLLLCLKRRWLTPLTGFLFSLIHYFLLNRISDVALSSPAWLSLLVMAIIWSIITPVLLAFSSVWQERYKRNKL
ncbi:DUF2878 domain-containing protein [Endozoicomonas montiporae]|nr:DUF2878 domain-containing protein [Endozoicomonas montiporae]